MEGGGDSLSGLIPIATSSWSNSVTSARIWNQHTCRTKRSTLLVTCAGKHHRRKESHRHGDIDEREVRVRQPPRDLDRFFQTLPALSPIHPWESLVHPRESGVILRS